MSHTLKRRWNSRARMGTAKFHVAPQRPPSCVIPSMLSELSIWETAWPSDIADAVAVFAGPDELAWLDSAASSGVSIIAARPVAVVEQVDATHPTFRVGERKESICCPWEVVRAHIAPLGARETPSAGALGPGWFGYFAYELGETLEPRLFPPRTSPHKLPLMRLALFDEVLVLDPASRRTCLIHDPAIRRRLNLPPASPAESLRRWESVADSKRSPQSAATIRSQTDPAQFLTAVARAKDYIAAGDTYQVNLSQQITLGPIHDPLAAYAALRRANPANYGALLRWDGAAVASVSPELFLEVREKAVRTCPIKGTRPRTLDPARDQLAVADLLASKKDAAELAMIVDLHRNDLGRVCEWGSVEVVEPRRLETHPTVFHTVAEIRGKLRGDRDAIDLLHACFPAGSISGVPKIRAMQIIRELEPHTRGVYTGAIGGISTNGNMTLSVAIRTLQIVGETGILHAGGGIVAESDPQAEYQETLAKIAGILRGLGIA